MLYGTDKFMEDMKENSETIDKGITELSKKCGEIALKDMTNAINFQTHEEVRKNQIFK